jgi:hypothetical protein
VTRDDLPELYDQLDPAVWTPDPQPDDIPGRRWSFVGAAGTKMAGITMTVSVDDNDEDELPCPACAARWRHAWDCPLRPDGPGDPS